MLLATNLASTGELRRITELPVFITTAISSVWAYLWLIIVYGYWTPNVIAMTEACLTLAMMPILIIVSYTMDRRPWERMKATVEDEETAALRVKSKDDVVSALLVFHRSRTGTIPVPSTLPSLPPFIYSRLVLLM